ncbi:hypothetical protein A2619_02010 [candidate division WWE3 bacterium RIFOXYD1_FULL_39_9]|uniref:CYTH domain-containing protein n=1 Tax=candidate division WWE3 bacterium RIFOXYD1_FULL_39_9 TaxID=1802649 RepID=A0A1F4X4R3_UNCKA|nr:MAG: hypothetical protein A2619_02010 [candidate division WWE3 bacterium RIFOXYD1_FULL_39_9]
MKNIEIKAKYNDLEKGRKIAESLKAKYVGCDHQVDTYFKTSRGRFKLRESSISGATLIPYQRENTQSAKSSSYVLFSVTDALETKNIFSSILGIDTVVEKKRHIYLKDNVRIHLDDVKGLGSFFELEAVCDENSIIEKESQKVNELLEIFQVKKEELLSGSYKEMSAI